MNTILPTAKPREKKLFTFVILFGVAISPQVRAQQTLSYVLLPDSTITPVSDGVPIGSSQPLTGSLSWRQYTPSFVDDCYTFYVTSLNFQAPGYSLTLTSGSPDSTTPSDPNGQTDMDAYVNWVGGPPGPYLIGGFNEGSYTGPATAPTRLELTEGFGLASGGLWQDYLYIDAAIVPVPEPSTLALLTIGTIAFTIRRKTVYRCVNTI